MQQALIQVQVQCALLPLPLFRPQPAGGLANRALLTQLALHAAADTPHPPVPRRLAGPDHAAASIGNLVVTPGQLMTAIIEAPGRNEGSIEHAGTSALDNSVHTCCPGGMEYGSRPPLNVKQSAGDLRQGLAPYTEGVTGWWRFRKGRPRFALQ